MASPAKQGGGNEMEIIEMVSIMKAQLKEATGEQIATVKRQAMAYMQNQPVIQEKRKAAAVIALQELGLLPPTQ